RRSTARSYCRTSSSNALVSPSWAWRMRWLSSTRVAGWSSSALGTRLRAANVGAVLEFNSATGIEYAPKSQLLTNKLVNGAMHRQDVARIIRYWFQLLPQANDMCIDSARGGEVLVSPNFLQQAISA